MTISRRTALAGAAAVVAVSPALAKATGPSQGDDPRLIELERQRDATLAAWNGAPRGMTDEMSDAFAARVDALDDQIIETPARGTDGLFVKWRHVQRWNAIGSGDGLDGACEAFEAALHSVLGRAS